MNEDARWQKVEEIVRRVIREELAAAGKSKARLEVVNGRWSGISDVQMAAWREAFPAVDVDAELKKMAAWIVSNPALAPKSQVGRFVNSWLTKSQNQASLRSIPLERPRQTEVKQKLCSYCERVATGAPNGRWACDKHFRDAMDGTPVPRMVGVTPKPVAGNG